MLTDFVSKSHLYLARHRRPVLLPGHVSIGGLRLELSASTAKSKDICMCCVCACGVCVHVWRVEDHILHVPMPHMPRNKAVVHNSLYMDHHNEVSDTNLRDYCSVCYLRTRCGDCLYICSLSLVPMRPGTRLLLTVMSLTAANAYTLSFNVCTLLSLHSYPGYTLNRILDTL